MTDLGWIQLGLQLVVTVGVVAAGYAKISSRLTAIETRQYVEAERRGDGLSAAMHQHCSKCPAFNDVTTGVRNMFGREPTNPGGGGF